MDLQQCQSNHLQTQSYLMEQVPEGNCNLLLLQHCGLLHASQGQSCARCSGPSHTNSCSWVTAAYQNCVQFYCTIITFSKGAARIIPLLSNNNIRSPVSFISESVVPTPCKFYKILCHASKHFCHTQSRSSDRPSCVHSGNKPKSEGPSFGASAKAFTS